MGDERRVDMDADSWIVLRHAAVTSTPAEFSHVVASMPATRDTITIHGKTTPIPRTQKLFGTAEYKYSGIRLVADPVVPPLVQRCVDYAKIHYPAHDWNGALVNLYLSGKDSVGAHSDDERDLQPGAPILSFSFGATRSFRVKAKPNHEALIPLLKLELRDRDLVVMGGRLQTGFVHEVPKTARVVDPRVNVTVRSLKSGSNKRVKVG